MINVKKIVDMFAYRFSDEKYKMEKAFQFVEYLKKEGLAPVFHRMEGPGTEPEVIINGKKFLMFSSNNYLGLSTAETVIQKAEAALKVHGIGPGGSRFLCGNIDVLDKLDHDTAELVGAEDSVSFPTGYMANVGIFKALMDPIMGQFPYKKSEGVIFSDEYNHGSAVDGCQMSYAKKITFFHNDLKDLENKIARQPKKRHKMIVTEGVFSPWGELSPLPEIVRIAKEYNAVLMVDDAHGVGVMGETGCGTVQHYNLANDVDIIMGSYDKALGGMGGFLAGNKNMAEYIRMVARPNLLSSAISGVLAGGLIEAIRLCQTDKERRLKLFKNADYLRVGIQGMGFKIFGDGRVPVVPVLIGNESTSIEFSSRLYDKGVFLPSFRWPAVPRGQSRMRITPMATHEKRHLDYLLTIFEDIGKKLHVIK